MTISLLCNTGDSVPLHQVIEFTGRLADAQRLIATDRRSVFVIHCLQPATATPTD